jgi:hypothetical protein
VAALAEAALTSVEPLRIIPGGRIWLRGDGFPIPSSPRTECTIGGSPAHIVFASHDRIALEAPNGLEGGPTELKAAWLPGATPFVDVGVLAATGLHQVDNPAIDAEERIYVTYSGTRGQQAPVSVFRVSAGGAREPLVTGIVNATSLAFSPEGRLHVSSRFDGTVYRVFDDGHFEVVASDLGLACGLAFAPDGTLFVGDRSGTVFQIDSSGRTTTLATLRASVAAFHLAMGPDEALYVSGPTLASYDRIHRIDMSGRVETIGESFGRPQGIAFDSRGVLHVVEALAGVSGLYAMPSAGPKTIVASGARLVGVAFTRDDRLLLASSDSVWQFSGPSKR